MCSSPAQPQEAEPATETPPSNNNEDVDSEDEEDNTKEPSGFDRFEKDFDKLTELISEIQKAHGFQPPTASAAAAATTESETVNTTSTTSAPNGEIIDHTNSDMGNSSVNPVPVASNDAGDANSDPNSDKDDYRKQVETLAEDVGYIKKHINNLVSSPNRDRIDELLHDLMDAALQSKEDFGHGSPNLVQLLHVVLKLKLWVPRQLASKLETSETTKKKKKKKESLYTSSKEKEKAAADIVKELVQLKIPDWGMADLLKSYESLKVTQKLCLLCFSVFPCEVDRDKKGGLIPKNIEINKKILIYWWVGEGFIDLHQEEDVASADANITKNPAPNVNQVPGQIQRENANANSNPKTKPNQNPGSGLNLEHIPNPDPKQHTPVDTATDGVRSKASQVSQQVSPAQNRKRKKTIEEIGEQILKVLTDKGFIEPVIVKGKESGSCQMHPFVQSFVAALAKKAGFFDFNNKNGKLKRSFTSSQRACLLKFQEKKRSSCELWAKHIESRDMLKRFETVQTLFNVNESIIDIRLEWFSKMKYLSVLHLGSWRSGTAEHIEVEDQKFLEELKNMEQLKLFSLQGVSTIMKLPDSVCKLSNLMILDLRECHNLEELPADIGSLKNLTHLDITNCHLLTKLPKGISLLSNLEVMRGFVINDQAGDLQEKNQCILSRWWKKAKGCVIHDLFGCKNKEICALRDLLKVEKLRELSIVVNRDEFPNSKELLVFKGMRNLDKLKISWEKSFKNEEMGNSGGETDANKGDNEAPEEAQNATNQEAESKSSSRGVEQEAQNDTNQEALTASICLDQIRKLELWCFPKEKADWLAPDQLKNLEKLYIKGGKLADLPGGSIGNKWMVSTLRLKYLPNLKITWKELQTNFPKIKYLEKYECNKLGLFPCDEEGVWKKR